MISQKEEIKLISDWKEQSLRDSLKWHKANMGSRLAPEMEKAFEAGYREGWPAAIQAAKLHKFIVVNPKREEEDIT